MNIPNTDALKQMEGTWKCLGESGDVYKLEIVGDALRFDWVSPAGARQELNGTSLTLLTRFDPHRFTFNFSDSGETATGIWRLDGKTLIVQLPEGKAEPYPLEFTSDKSKLWVFERR